MQRWLDKNRLNVGIVAALIALMLSMGGLFNRGDFWVLDGLFALRGPIAHSDEIAIIGIDDAALQSIGHPWPWPRHLHANLIQGLHRIGARVVALDLLFVTASNVTDDRALATALRYHRDTILPINISTVSEGQVAREVIEQPFDAFTDGNTPVGFVNLPADPDGVIRRTRMRHGAWCAFAKIASDIQLGRGMCRKVTSSEKEHRPPSLINFVGPPGSFPTFPYHEVLDGLKTQNDTWANLLKGKLVMIGFTSRQTDTHQVPFSRWGGASSPGVEIHANIANAELTGATLNAANQTAVAISASLIALCSIAAFHLLRVFWAAVVTLILVLVALAFVVYAFMGTALFIPLCTVLAPTLFSGGSIALLRTLATR